MSLYVDPSVQVTEVLEYLDVEEEIAKIFPNTELVRVRLKIRWWDGYHEVIKLFSKEQWEHIQEQGSYSPNIIYPKGWK